ncbi:ATP-dependent DNA helicase [Diplogelasinospora grovesii]|uniref:ATP-dependent DNA helicase n=1 Tax=Diplogelasinospora grovesii TaxID=303347 RepID=A0AAN6NGW8_9PEZI|nr:ATP-dependent DNA helicase [Diplogelasinospora grovesii]
MDDDEFDDIPDEDLMLALTQATSKQTPQVVNSAGQKIGVFPSPNIRRTAQLPGRIGAGQANKQPAASRDRRPGNTPNGANPDLGDVPSDAFESSPETHTVSGAHPPQRQLGRASSFRQTTLWGDTLQEDDSQSQSQGTSNRPYRGDLPPEVPTHHELNHEELNTWVYPLNLGAIRDYQFTIVKSGLFNNTLVALPTGLGKTFIAATVMLNFFRWTKKAKIVFVAPTKPLASQQVQACLTIAGIPRSQATLLTGETPPVLREAEWENRRLFFMTPQTLINDLSKGYADPKSIVLLVIDEAHRSTGDYAYVKVVEFVRRFSKSFRVLALTATPGSTVEGVQDVIDNLGISHVEIRTEESLDIRQYVHSRSIDTVTFDPSDEMLEVRDLFSKALKPLVDKLSSANIYYGRDPMSLTTYGLLKARQDWMNGPGRHVNQGTKFMMMAVFSILQSLAHSIKLLNFHGIKPFYHSLVEFRSTEEGKGEKGSKYKRQLLGDENFKKMLTMIERWMKMETFNGHPKLTYLCETLVNHFMDAGEGSSTRAIVFSEYRDSAEEIVRILNSQPLIRATVFVGQADSKRSEGMKQKQQIETIEKFKTGTFNVLVATSIGEEGLDIGQVDLIVCYDASSSPIRMLQRMGRTGRKRAGNIVLLLMKGKEEEKFAEAKDNYQKMQSLICEGSRFTFRHDLSTRIVPRDIRPEVDKRHVDIPIENSQDTSLPEPRKTAAGLRKKAAKKKFNMPDGVETGFMSVAAMLGKKTARKDAGPSKPPEPVETDFLVDVPHVGNVVLGTAQTAELNRLYRQLPSSRLSQIQVVEFPRLAAFPAAQRVPRRTARLKHGEHTKRWIKLFATLGKSQDPEERYTTPYGETDKSEWRALPCLPFVDDTDKESSSGTLGASTTGSAQKRPRPIDISEDDEEEDVPEPAPRPRRRQAAATAAKTTRKTPVPKSRTSSMFRPASAFLHDCEDDDNEEEEEEEEDEEEDQGEEDADDDDDEEAEPVTKALPVIARSDYRSRKQPKKTSTAAAKGKSKAGGRKAASKSKSGLKRKGDDLEDVGDDCTRTSDMEVDTDGSDDGADLEGFVVGDNEVTFASSMQDGLRSTSPTTPPDLDLDSSLPPAKKSAGARKRRDESPKLPVAEKEAPFYVPMHFTQTQETADDDDELPDFDQLAARTSSSAKMAEKGRRMPMDLDDDDDDDSDDNILGLPKRSRGNNRDSIQKQTEKQSDTATRKRRRPVLADSDDDDD